MNTWQLPLTSPKHLTAGDTVAVVSPSFGGPAAFPHRYAAGKRQLEEAFGVRVVEMEHTLKDESWLTRNPEARASDIMAAFVDPKIDAIVAAIGGDDAVRVLPFLDLDIIAANPKIFMGYSDTTALHFACMKAGLRSFYGPSIMAGFGENEGLFDYMEASVRRNLCSTEVIGEVSPNANGWTVEHLSWAEPENQSRHRTLQPSTGPRLLRGDGVVQGRLIGGCADVLEMLKGTEWWPPLDVWRGAILFYETSEEAPSPTLVTRWLRNFAAQGILQVLGGIIAGRPGGQIAPEMFAEYDAAILQALDEVGLSQLPVLANMDFGHTDPMFTLPYGAKAEIDCGQASLRILEAGVV